MNEEKFILLKQNLLDDQILGLIYDFQPFELFNGSKSVVLTFEGSYLRLNNKIIRVLEKYNFHLDSVLGNTIMFKFKGLDSDIE